MRNWIYYHHPCPDGVFGALCAYLYFQPRRNPTAIVAEDEGVPLDEAEQMFPPYPVPLCNYVPLSHTSTTDKDKDMETDLEFIHSDQGDVVYLIDCIGPPGFVSKLCAKAKKVVLLDHHKTAKEQLDEMKKAGELPVNLTIVMDMTRSGAEIALTYFRDLLDMDSRGVQQLEVSPSVLKKIRFVQDNDLWRHEIMASKAFYTGLGELKIDYNFMTNPKVFTQLIEFDIDSTIELGIQATAKREEELKEMLQHTFTIQLKDVDGVIHNCLAAESTGYEYASELGHRLCSLATAKGFIEMGVVVMIQTKSPLERTVKVCLRSLHSEEKNPHGVDTTRFSKVHGGGGHKGASGFMITPKEFEEL